MWYSDGMKAIDWTAMYRRYKGKWVALKSDQKTVVGSGNTLKAAKNRAEKKGYKMPILMRVPRKMMHFVGGYRIVGTT